MQNVIKYFSCAIMIDFKFLIQSVKINQKQSIKATKLYDDDDDDTQDQ